MSDFLNDYFNAGTKVSVAMPDQLNGNPHVAISTLYENNAFSREDLMFLEKLYSLIEKNLDNQNFNLNDLMKNLYLNRTHFFQKVKRLTNQTPFTLLKTYRLNRATEILAQKKLSVNEVYVMVGFKSRTHFTKAFKETYHISPSRYASDIRNNTHLVSNSMLNIPFEILN